MAGQKRPSRSSKARAVAKTLHRKATSGPRKPAKKIYIAPENTASGSGAIRFRAARMLEAYRTGRPGASRSTKASTTR